MNKILMFCTGVSVLSTWCYLQLNTSDDQFARSSSQKYQIDQETQAKNDLSLQQKMPTSREPADIQSKDFEKSQPTDSQASQHTFALMNRQNLDQAKGGAIEQNQSGQDLSKKEVTKEQLEAWFQMSGYPSWEIEAVIQQAYQSLDDQTLSRAEAQIAEWGFKELAVDQAIEAATALAILEVATEQEKALDRLSLSVPIQEKAEQQRKINILRMHSQQTLTGILPRSLDQLIVETSGLQDLGS